MKNYWFAGVIVVLIIAALMYFFVFKKQKTNEELQPEEKKSRSNPDVVALQVKINSLLPAGIEKLKTDGIWGTKTQAAYDLVFGNAQKNSTNTGTSSINAEKLKEYGNKLHGALKAWPNNYFVILDVFDRLNNKADFNALVNAFGKRAYEKEGELGLIAWLYREMDSSNMVKVKEKLKKIEVSL
jgi:hypothetical protein